MPVIISYLPRNAVRTVVSSLSIAQLAAADVLSRRLRLCICGGGTAGIPCRADGVLFQELGVVIELLANLSRCCVSQAFHAGRRAHDVCIPHAARRAL